jgi:arginyl-tRNA synthetase
MADPLLVLTSSFRHAITTAFGDAHADLDPLVRRSDRADYQANFAMGLAKKLGKKPREVAEAVAQKLDLTGVAREVTVAGPGFINVTLDDAWLTGQITVAAGDPSLGIPKKEPEVVVIDYSGPNAAKEMHVGHMRSTIIGDALARTFEKLGATVVRQNHIGDWGTPFGMLIEQLGPDADLPVDRLTALYQEARAKFDADPAFAERARKRVVLLQAGDEGTNATWRTLVLASRRYFSEVYAKLGVTLTDTDIAGESSYNDVLADTIDELANKGLVTESQGALCVFPPGAKNREGEPLPLILRKGDGGYGYPTTDLAALRHRTRKLGAQRILYVVGAPQVQHLAMVFNVGKLAGWLAPTVRAEHVAFGSILGPDKKMLKTRSGESVKLVDLLDEAEQRARTVVDEKSSELDQAQRARIARAVGIGAIKYADLSNDRIKDYVFDWDRMLAFEGNTAPYLMYAHARNRSILRKAGEALPTGTPIVVGHPSERALALELLSLGTIVLDVAETLEPHRLCTYLYGLATKFTELFDQCPVLKAETPALRASRLALCDLTARTIAAGLDLLGIQAPERM